MKKMKKLFLFLPLAAALAFSGCMTPQVEIRMEYDKLTRAITAVEDRRDDYLAPAANDGVKAVLGFIYDTAHAAKTMVETFAGLEKSVIDGINPAFGAMLMQSVAKDGQSQSEVTEYPYFVKDLKISVMTFGFSVKSVSDAEKTAEAYFTLSVTGTALKSEGGETLKDADGKDITYAAMVFLLSAFNPSAPAAINLHSYKVSADTGEIPAYHLTYGYVKTDGEWKINALRDGNSPIYQFAL